MSQTIVKSSTNKKTVYNPKFLAVTPYSGNDLGTTTYLLQEVIRDSTSISQDEAETNNIENEFSSSPIVTNVVPGSYNFAANVGDMQADLLKALMGFKVDSESGIAYAPAGYVEVFAKVELVFQVGGTAASPTYLAVVLPRVQLNASVTIESLNSSVGTIAIAGIANEVEVEDGTNSYRTAMYVDPDFDVSPFE